MQATLAVGVLAVLMLAGCSPSQSPEPSGAPEPAIADSAPPTAAEQPRVESLADIAGTRWEGVDSQGDSIMFKFEEGGQLTFFSYGSENSFEQDTWSADAETLTWQASFGGPFGRCTYTGAFEADAQVIDASYTCDAPGASGGTIELERPPE